MLDELVVVHLPRTNEHNKFLGFAFQPGLEWQTCLRRVVLLNQSAALPLEPGLEVYRGEQAYQFLLEIICGLHSPLVGETEVMGQFREFCLSAHFPATAWGQFLRQMTAELLADAKRIRQHHLQKLGSQSYGSLARQALKGLPTVAVLGAGQLVQEMLPWLTGHAQVRVFARNPRKAAAALKDFPEVHVAELNRHVNAWANQPTDQPAALIVAAPLSATEVCAWANAQDVHFVKTLDLRGESAEDPLWLVGSEVLDLAALFASLEAERKRIAERALAARHAVALLAQRQTRQVQCRPYGWEDVCA
jgi:glutamyl-tRNA reductase